MSKKIITKPNGKQRRQQGGRAKEQQWTPTDEDRQLVVRLARAGFTLEQIADAMACCSATVKKRFKEEVKEGREIAHSLVSENLFKIATGDSRNAVAAAIWWEKSRRGFSEKSAYELSGPDGGPIVQSFVDAPQQETLEQWEQRQQRRIAAEES